MRLSAQSEAVSKLVSHLEEARSCGALGSVLDEVGSSGPEGKIIALYRKFIDQPFVKSRFRSKHVRTIVQEAIWPLRRPEIVFPGTLRKRQRINRETGEILDKWDVMQLESTGFVLRPDQILSARYWGIGFDLDSHDDVLLLEESLLDSSVASLVHMLRSLEQIEPHFRRSRYENPHILPPRRTSDFEQLLIDVLNEHYCKARHAPFIEDVLEKTDIRVQVQGVHRRRGARVQITTTTDPLFYQNKLANINRLEEIVVLSPASIARFVSETGKELGAFKGHGSGTKLLEERADAIRRTLIVALEPRHESPLGPLVSVPEDLRAVIREFMELEAARSTDALRDREVQGVRIRRIR